MLALLFYSVAAFGLAWGLGRSTLTYPARSWLAEREGGLPGFLLALIECPACLGFWIGLAAGIILPIEFPIGVNRWAGAPLLGLWTTGFNFVLGRATGLITLEDSPPGDD